MSTRRIRKLLKKHVRIILSTTFVFVATSALFITNLDKAYLVSQRLFEWTSQFWNDQEPFISALSYIQRSRDAHLAYGVDAGATGTFDISISYSGRGSIEIHEIRSLAWVSFYYDGGPPAEIPILGSYTIPFYEQAPVRLRLGCPVRIPTGETANIEISLVHSHPSYIAYRVLIILAYRHQNGDIGTIPLIKPWKELEELGEQKDIVQIYSPTAQFISNPNDTFQGKELEIVGQYRDGKVYGTSDIFGGEVQTEDQGLVMSIVRSDGDVSPEILGFPFSSNLMKQRKILTINQSWEKLLSLSQEDDPVRIWNSGGLLKYRNSSNSNYWEDFDNLGAFYEAQGSLAEAQQTSHDQGYIEFRSGECAG